MAIPLNSFIGYISGCFYSGGFRVKYKIVLIDIDDTLLDFGKSSVVSFEKTMAILGLKEDWKSLYSSFQMVSAKLWQAYEKGEVDRLKVRFERFIQSFELHKIDLDPIKASQIYLEMLCENVFYIDGAIDVLNEVKRKELTLGLITNGVSFVQEKRINNGPIKGLIDFMVVSEDCEAPKPHPSMFQKCFELSKAQSKSEILLLGDSLSSDIAGALNFGIDCCWFNPKNISSKGLEPTYQIEKLSDFLKYL